jgi:hypothetical protein
LLQQQPDAHRQQDNPERQEQQLPQQGDHTHPPYQQNMQVCAADCHSC